MIIPKKSIRPYVIKIIFIDYFFHKISGYFVCLMVNLLLGDFYFNQIICLYIKFVN
jgi:hypothetical protein